MSFIFIEENTRKKQKNIDNGNSPVNPLDKKARNNDNPDNIRYDNFSVLMFLIAKNTDADTNIFIVFSKKLFEQAHPFKGINIQKNNGTQLYE
tara:strand:+ start:114 stop:392 length:279 start_codon:yes stop_codon:yes gene_type:complete